MENVPVKYVQRTIILKKLITESRKELTITDVIRTRIY